MKEDRHELETHFVEWFADEYPKECIPEEYYLVSVRRVIEKLESENKRLNKIVRDQATIIAKKMGKIIKLEKALEAFK